MSQAPAPPPTLQPSPTQASLDRAPAPCRAGLALLCICEAAERFAATAVGSVLVLQLSEQYGLSPGEALRLAGLFHGLCYALPILGGMLSDRLGRHDMPLLLGSLFLALGYFALVFAVPAWIVPVLLLLAGGHALFKPSIAALLGQADTADNNHTGSAFAWFYIAANAGGLLGPLCAGLLLTYAGWPSVGGLAASSLACCMILMGRCFRTLQSGVRLADAAHGPRRSSPASVPLVRPIRELALVLGALVVAGGGLAQLDGAILLWVRSGVQRRILGFDAPVAWFSALPALLVLLVSPLLTCIERRATRYARMPGMPRKILFGLLCMSLAFLVFALLSLPLPSAQRVHMAWLLTAYPLLALGELLVIPALQSRLASLLPTTRAGLAGGLFFASLAAGQWLSGLIGPLWTCIAPSSYFGIWAMLLAAVACLWRRL